MIPCVSWLFHKLTQAHAHANTPRCTSSLLLSSSLCLSSALRSHSSLNTALHDGKKWLSLFLLNILQFLDIMLLLSSHCLISGYQAVISSWNHLTLSHYFLMLNSRHTKMSLISINADIFTNLHQTHGGVMGQMWGQLTSSISNFLFREACRNSYM